MDRGKSIVQEESANLSSNPLFSEYQCSSENVLPHMGIQQPFPAFTSPFHAAPPSSIPHMDWNPGTMLDNLTFIEEKIGQVKNVIRSMAGLLSTESGELTQQQQVNADLTCLIVQIISTAGSLLPSLKNSSFLSHPPAENMANLAGTGSTSSYTDAPVPGDHPREGSQSPDYEEFFKGLTDGAVEGFDIIENDFVKDQDVKDGDESGEVGVDGDCLPLGSYELLQLEEDEILAPHTHFCAICGKGFKRDANLRMHMRGHGDEYKSHAALARPPRDTSTDQAAMAKRYSCPFSGCKRNKQHKNFLPLKTIMCVKNHYKRSHCEKTHTCSRCHSKKFSIMADLRTHEKHCGQVKWLCSCGTSFTRKDKLFAHVGLFKGHTPLLPADEPEASSYQVAREGSHQESAKVAVSMATGSSFMPGNSSGNGGEPLGVEICNDGFLSTTNFGSLSFSLGQYYGFPEDHSQDSFRMLPPDHYENAEKNGDS